MKRAIKHKEEIDVLLDNLKLARQVYEEESQRIMWSLTKYTSKSDIARRLGLDRKTLYNRYFKQDSRS